jgi:dTDP-4-amino-4,6-dideoxygalactose transaminase
LRQRDDGVIRFNKPTIGKKDLESVLYCMIKDDLAPGAYMKSFASLLGQEMGIGSVAVFNSYLHVFDCLYTVLEACAGDEAILPSFSRPEILHAIGIRGLKPILVDLEEDSFLPSYDQIEKKRGVRTRFLVVSQMFGVPYDLTRYHELGVPIVENLDGCIGASVNGKVTGTFGTFTVLHFNDHAMVTTGNGGMLASKDREWGRAIQAFRNDPARNECLMSDFNASLGISQMNKLKKSIEARRKIGQYYDEAVYGSGSALIGRDDCKELTYSSYAVKTSAPFEDCQRFFKRHGIPVQRGLERPLHSILGEDVREYPLTEEMCNTLIALPIYPSLGREEIETISKSIRAIL